jgi:hypothetical protein
MPTRKPALGKDEGRALVDASEATNTNRPTPSELPNPMCNCSWRPQLELLSSHIVLIDQSYGMLSM